MSNTVKISPYTVVDASGSITLSSSVEGFAQVENVLNALDVVSEYGYDARGAPRQLFAGFRTRFGALARPQVPARSGGN